MKKRFLRRTSRCELIADTPPCDLLLLILADFGKMDIPKTDIMHV